MRAEVRLTARRRRMGFILNSTFTAERADIMHIQFERSGGIAGIRLTHSVSSEVLPAEEEKKLAELVEAARFFELPATMRAMEPGADRFQYKISVETEQGKHTVQVDEVAVPAQLQPLLAWLKTAVRKR